MELDEVYFYTATINNWVHLLEADEFKRIVLDSLIFLVKQKKIEIYGFVIMPNHIHVIWSGLDLNGKEKPFTSFMKFTGHRFLSELRKTDEELLAKFKTDLMNRNYLFWQTNALAKKVLDRKCWNKNWIIFILIHYRRTGVWLTIPMIIIFHRARFMSRRI